MALPISIYSKCDVCRLSKILFDNLEGRRKTVSSFIQSSWINCSESCKFSWVRSRLLLITPRWASFIWAGAA